MKAFHGNEELKVQAIADMQAHIAADQLVKGQYWEDGKGCFIGCAVKTRVGDDGKNHTWHEIFQERYNIDKRLAELFDALFEGVPNERAMRWPIEVYSAIRVSSDVSKVADEFQYWLLTGDKSPLAFSFKEDVWGVWNAIKGVAALYAERLNGNEPTPKSWDAAWDAAGDAARAAAWAAARAAAGEAARAAAGEAARAAAGEAARAAAYIAMADKLLELLINAPQKQ
jgi:hypothetical protein